MVERIVPGHGYNFIYNEYDDDEIPINGGVIKELVRYELTGSSKLYAVNVTYDKSLSPNKYYIVANTEQDARKKFKNIYTWMNQISSVDLVNDYELEYVLAHPQKVCLR